MMIQDTGLHVFSVSDFLISGHVTGDYKELKREAVQVWRDKEAQVGGVCEIVESHLWSTDSQPAYRESGRCVPLGPRPAVLH